MTYRHKEADFRLTRGRDSKKLAGQSWRVK